MTRCHVCSCDFVGRCWCTKCFADLRPTCPACQAAHRRVAPLLCRSCVESYADKPRGNVMRYRVVVERPGLPPSGAILRSEAVATVAADKLRALYPTARITVEKR